MNIAKENRIKKCRECENPFEVNRLDQKFCSRKCRNRYNNRRVRVTNYDTQSIDNILHKNYRILKTAEYLEMTRSELNTLGFNFKYFTHFKKTKNGNFVFFLYDYAYYFNKEKRIKIIEPKN